MHFCHKRKLHPDPLLTLNKINIPIVTETKFLGLFFDNKLSYIPHLKYLRAKCLKSMNLLRIVAHKDWGGDSQTVKFVQMSHQIQTRLWLDCVWRS